MPSKERLAALQAKMDAAREKQKKLMDQLRQAQSAVQKEERKHRTRELIEIGGLAEIADIRSWDRPVILGMMLDAAKSSSDSQRETWRRSGLLVLTARAAQKTSTDKTRLTNKQPPKKQAPVSRRDDII